LLGYLKHWYKNLLALSLPVKIFIVIAVFMSFYMGFLRDLYLQNPQMAALKSTSEGLAPTPFQYRILMPWLIDHVATWLTLPSPRIVIKLYESLMAFLTALALYAYLSSLCKNAWLALVFALGLFYIYPFLYFIVPWSRAYYASDIASILLFTLGLYFLHGRRFWPYYVVLAVGLFNRETIAFLLLGFAFSQYGQMERRPFAMHIIGQILLIVAIKLWLAYIFRGNPGAGLYSLDDNLSESGMPATIQSSRLYLNVMQFTKWKSFVNMTSFMGFLWLPLIFLWNRIEDNFVRKIAFIIPCFVAGMFVVGNLYEFRIFGELVPIFLGTLCHIAASGMKRAPLTRK
jgi:hypothetical protein